MKCSRDMGWFLVITISQEEKLKKKNSGRKVFKKKKKRFQEEKLKSRVVISAKGLQFWKETEFDFKHTIKDKLNENS